MCLHRPQCPSALASDRLAARVTVSHPEQGWSLLCNGIVLFDDAGALLPGGHALVPPATLCPGDVRDRRWPASVAAPARPCRLLAGLAAPSPARPRWHQRTRLNRDNALAS